MKLKLFLSIICVCSVSFANFSPEELATVHSGEAQKLATSSDNDSLWTTWARKPTLLALLALMKLRDRLLATNLFSSYSDSEYPKTTTCDKNSQVARTADGTCNSLKIPLMGAANTRFGRNVPLKSAYPDQDRLMYPNPRDISLKLMTRKEFKPLSRLNLFAVSWVQFMIHDWVNHKNQEYASDSVHEIPLRENDPSGQQTMLVPKTVPDLTIENGKAPAYLNTTTHWWDGSQLYGNSLDAQNELRLFMDGKMKMGANNLLPVGSNGIEKTGVTANWWLGLSLMHQLFTKEHNKIAERLKLRYPNWTDQKIFDVARLVNSALMAKIQTTEWTYALNHNKAIKIGQKMVWDGFLGLGPIGKSLIGSKTNLRGVPYSMTEEFVSAYRFHPFLPESVTLLSYKKEQAAEVVPLVNMRNENSHILTEKYKMTDLLYSFGKAKAGAQALNNYPNFMQNLEVPVLGKMDLAAVDILRDRERGVPRYNEFRRLLHLKPIRKFEDLSRDPVIVKNLKDAYFNDVELLDLMVGTLAEETRPEGLGFGETFFQVFLMMTPRRLEADRFYTSDFRKEIYSSEGLKWVKDNSLKTVLLRHHPELSQALDGLESPFQPWN